MVTLWLLVWVKVFVLQVSTRGADTPASSDGVPSPDGDTPPPGAGLVLRFTDKRVWCRDSGLCL